MCDCQKVDPNLQAKLDCVDKQITKIMTEAHSFESTGATRRFVGECLGRLTELFKGI